MLPSCSRTHTHTHTHAHTHTHTHTDDEYLESLHSPNKTRPFHDPGVCEDTHGNCAEWARGGECDKNPGFM